MGRTVRARPVDLAPSPWPWPWPSSRSDDALGEYARLWVLRLIDVVGDRSIRSVAEGADSHHSTLDGIIAGRVWPNLATIAKLELSLGVVLHSQLSAASE